MKSKRLQLKWWHYLLIFLGICFLMFWVWSYTHSITGTIHPELQGIDDYAKFGDSYGAINALFSGFAFAGVLIALIMQMNELSLQREELSLSRKEYTVNRISNIIYRQLDIIKKGVDSLVFNNTLVGMDLIIEMNKLIQQHQIGESSNLVGSTVDQTRANIEIALFNKFSQTKNMNDLIISVEASSQILLKLLNTNRIDTNDQIILKSIFLDNVSHALNNLFFELEVVFEKLVARENVSQQRVNQLNDKVLPFVKSFNENIRSVENYN